MDQMVQITMNRWNEAKGPIWTTYPNRYRDRPICRYIGLRPSTGPDGPSIRHGPQGSDIGNFHPSNPISEMILGRPSDRFGKQSAPECRGAFCIPCSGTDTEHTGKAIKTDIRTRNKAKRKASQKENTQKKKPSTTKSKTKEQAIQQQTENIHTHNQSRKPKTIPTKKKPRASCTRLRQFRRKRRNCRYKSSSGGVLGRYRDKLRRNDVTKTWKATMSGRFARSVESRSMNDTGRSKEIRRKGIIMSSTANVGTVTLVC